MSRKSRYCYALLLPSLVILVAMNIYPLIYSLGVSFTDVNLASFSSEHNNVGFDNYRRLLSDAQYLRALLTTGTIVLGAVAVQFVLGMIVALLLFRFGAIGRMLLSLFLLPMMLTPIIVGIMWRLLLNYDVGLVNAIVQSIGLERHAFLGQPRTAVLSIILVDSWQWTPFMVLLLYSGLSSIPQEPIEAARIDGASSPRVFVHVVLPALRNTIALSLLIRSMDVLREYDKVFTMTYGGPGTATETVSFYIYRVGFKMFDIGYAAAGSYILLIITIAASRFMLSRLSERPYAARRTRRNVSSALGISR